MARKKRIDPEELRRARAASEQFRQMVAQRERRLAAWDEAERQRRERLRRWSFGLLGH